MSITAEKIGEALAYLESEYSIKECCGHPVGGNGPEDEPACCAQPDLYLRSDKVKETLLSLLQQGEPEGWKPMKFPYTETFAAISDAVEWREHRTLGISVRKFEEAFNKNMALSASPLPPAPGAETGE